jgi:hypothetical protein
MVASVSATLFARSDAAAKIKTQKKNRGKTRGRMVRRAKRET